MEVKSFEEIYNDMRDYIIARQDRLTDFNYGSVLASLIEAFSNELETLYIRCRVGYSTFLRSLPYSVFNFHMKEGTKASTEVIFSRSRPFSYETSIPAGTEAAAGDKVFVTSAAGKVLSGEMNSLPIPAAARSIGSKYNISAGSVKKIISTLPADIVMVDNPVPATGGDDGEDWAAYSARFAEYILGLQRTNLYGFLSGLTSGPLVRSLGIIEHFPPHEGLWNMTVYLEDGSGGMADEAMEEAMKIINGTGTSRDGGYRAPGIKVRYLRPEILPVILRVKVTPDSDAANEIDEPRLAVLVSEAAQKFINAYKIEQSLLVSDITVALKRLPFLRDVKVLEPEENIMVSVREIVRFQECAVEAVFG